MRPPRISGTILCLLVLLSLAASLFARPPNVIFILADDLGYADLGCYGSKYYETPNIDRLASEGMRFTDGYACGPTCQPTRAALLSGQYGPRTGIYTTGSIDLFDWSSRPLRPVPNVTDLPLDRKTIAEMLQGGGYATAIFGKWHLGDEGGYLPQERGFEDAVTTLGGYYNFRTQPPAEIPPGTYLTDYLTDRAVEYIRREHERPFFLYLPHLAVHPPYEAKPELEAHFRKKMPSNGQDDPVYAAMISSLDESVGRILKVLSETGLEQETLVILSSDNGGSGGYEREGVLKLDEATTNGPLRGGEGMLYEGGIRVPYIFRWPGKIAAGSHCDAAITSVDLYPTLLSIAGVSTPRQVLDGENYLPLLANGGNGTLHRDAIYWHFPGYLGAGGNTWRAKPAGAIRAGDWKLLEFFEDNRLELYNLREDIGEQHNLAEKEPGRARELRERLVQWRHEVGARMPTRNPDRQAPWEPKFSRRELLQ